MLTCEITGTVYEVDGTPKSGGTLYVRRVIKDGVLLSTTDLPVTIGDEGQISFTLPRGCTAWLDGAVEGFNAKSSTGVPVTIPDAPTANLEDLLPAVFPTSTAVSQATFNAHVATVADADTLGHIKGGGTGYTIESDGTLNVPVVDAETVQDALSTFFPDSAPFDWTYDDTGDRETLDIAAATSTQKGLMSAADKSKLDGVATGATANSSDATLLERANHTGTQASSTISDFASAVAALIAAAVGVTLQAYSAVLTAFAALSPSNDDLLQRKAGAWTNRTPSQVKIDLALTKADVGLGSVVNADTTTTANITDSTNKRFVTDAQSTVLGNTSGVNTGDQTGVTGNAGTATALQTARTIDGQSFDGTTNVTVVAPGTHAATSKASPVDADELPLVDSAASFVLKRLTWANLKATLKTYFDTLYPSGSGTHSGTSSGTNTGDQTSIVGITGTTAQFNAALTDNDFATLAGAETLTNKTLTSPTLTAPALGVATATSINKVVVTAPASSATLTIADGKVLTASKTLTLDGTDGTTHTFPSTTSTLARTDAAQTFTGNQTLAGDLLSGTDGGRTIGAAAASRFSAYLYGLNIGNTGAISAGILKVGATTSGMALQSGFLQLGSSVGLGWSSGDVFSVGEDTRIKRAKAAVLEINAASSAGGTFRTVPTTPAQMTASQDNYNPGGVSRVQRWSSDASRNVTGLSISQVDGETHMIINVGSNPIVLVNESASSTAGNRFTNSTGADITLSANQAADIEYDGTSARWRVFKRT